jgi:hypothetical protein
MLWVQMTPSPLVVTINHKKLNCVKIGYLDNHWMSSIPLSNTRHNLFTMIVYLLNKTLVMLQDIKTKK